MSLARRLIQHSISCHCFNRADAPKTSDLQRQGVRIGELSPAPRYRLEHNSCWVVYLPTPTVAGHGPVRRLCEAVCHLFEAVRRLLSAVCRLFGAFETAVGK